MSGLRQGRECVHRAEYQIQERHLLSEEIKWISASTGGKEGVVKYAGRLLHGSELFEEDPFLQLLSPTPLSANLGSSTCCISQEAGFHHTDQGSQRMGSSSLGRGLSMNSQKPLPHGFLF